MKYKRSTAGFSFVFITLLLFILLALATTALYTTRHQKNGLITQNSAKAPQYVDQDIQVTFKDGVTFQQADSLVKSFSLSYMNPQADQENGFIPHFYRAIKKIKFDQVAANLKNYSEVVSFADVSSDPVNNRANSDEYWTKIVFKEDTTWSRIKKIFVDSGFGLSNQSESGFTLRTFYLVTPKGQESLYVTKFKQDPIVKSAERLGRPVNL